MMRCLYTLFICGYGALIRLAAPFTPKARQWTAGRRQQKHLWEKPLPEDQPVLWMHCASLGEFEQGRPVLEAFRQAHPAYRVILTFYSPSGYEIRKNYNGADLVAYLPLDTPHRARQFVEKVHPDLVFFIKYEFWFNILKELSIRYIPAFLISGIFREKQHFFRWYGGWFRRQLNSFTHFFVQSGESAELLQRIGITRVSVSGDTRFDRVAAIAKNPPSFPAVQRFTGTEPVLIAGSTWPEDERLLLPVVTTLLNRMKLIIAPHEISETHIRELLDYFSDQAVPLSKLVESTAGEKRVIVVDSIGQLSGLYQYASFAYVGGGFGKGIHNILEPATFGLPVLFGPRYQKFREAVELIAEGAVFSIQDAHSLKQKLERLLHDSSFREDASGRSLRYITTHAGATERILSEISPWISQTNQQHP